MTLSATCATGEISPSPSYYRAEQYDADLGLYYLRARYYNPLTGRFLSRDPSPDDSDDDDDEDADFTDADGNDLTIPATLHKYLYTGGDPVSFIDPDGRAATTDYALIVQLGALTAATGVAIYNYDLHANETQAALQELGASISCAYNELATEFGAWIDVGLAGDGDAGTVSRAGPCTFEYSPHKKGKNPGKHEKGEGRRKGDYGGRKGDKGYPKRPPGDRKGPGKWPGRWPPPPWAPPKSPPYPPKPWWPPEPPPEPQSE
jgi:RHS repeat-associated protein